MVGWCLLEFPFDVASPSAEVGPAHVVDGEYAAANLPIRSAGASSTLIKLRLLLQVVGVGEVDARRGDLNAQVIQHEAADPGVVPDVEGGEAEASVSGAESWEVLREPHDGPSLVAVVLPQVDGADQVQDVARDDLLVHR
jgi:hypothetical protein